MKTKSSKQSRWDTVNELKPMGPELKKRQNYLKNQSQVREKIHGT